MKEKKYYTYVQIKIALPLEEWPVATVAVNIMLIIHKIL
jgi:hypothetical protein